MRRDVRHRGSPGRECAVADARLRPVVDDHSEVRVPVEHAQRVAAGAAAVRARRRRGRARSSRRTPGRARDEASQSSSASSCTIGRSPTSFASAASRAMRSAASGAANGAQPTTPATNGVVPARSSRKRVSAIVGAAWTRIVASIPRRARMGARSAGPKSR